MILDSRLNFVEHAEQIARKTAASIDALSRLLPNVKGSGPAARRLLTLTITSKLLYGAPVWALTISGRGMDKLSVVYRRCAYRVACCYRTTSYKAVCVLEGMPLFNLLVDERRKSFAGEDVAQVKTDTLSNENGRQQRKVDGRFISSRSLVDGLTENSRR